VPFGIINYNDNQRKGFCLNNKQSGFCSNHGVQQPWNKIKGMITHKEFINNGGKIINTNERDHLYATSNINIKKWKFMYQNIDKNEQPQKKDLNKMAYILSRKILF
jgi:hypothetical protein